MGAVTTPRGEDAPVAQMASKELITPSNIQLKLRQDPGDNRPHGTGHQATEDSDPRCRSSHGELPATQPTALSPQAAVQGGDPGGAQGPRIRDRADGPGGPEGAPSHMCVRTARGWETPTRSTRGDSGATYQNREARPVRIKLPQSK